MKSSDQQLFKQSKRLMLLIAFQLLCALYFTFDVANDFIRFGESMRHGIPEVVATIALFIGIIFELNVLRGCFNAKNACARGLALRRANLPASWKTISAAGA